MASSPSALASAKRYYHKKIAGMSPEERDQERVRVRDNSRHLMRQRQAALAEYKQEYGCVDCGYRENPDALEFDHVRGEKVRNVMGMVSARIDKLLLEVLKCDVRCANCHAIRTVSLARKEF